MKSYNEFRNLILESAPRIPKSEEYWKKKGKSGKNVCLIFHDDLDGIVSAVLMKNYLKKQGFTIKQYGVINYQEGWQAFRIDSKLITIALDFAEDIPGVDVYVDHHGSFDDEVKQTQKRPSIKTKTGSAAEGIAQQIGEPFSSDIKDWIDMIDSAKYNAYDIDIKGILDFDLKEIVKSKNSKLKFAAAMNQLLKRGDDRTIIEVVYNCDYPSIYNIYRLFKLFFPKNNPDWKSGVEPEFVESGVERMATMKQKTIGSKGFDEEGKKIIYDNFKDFWNDFAVELEKQPGNWQLKPGNYQIIGNLMFVPSGTWANALRAKAIFVTDVENGVVPDDPKLNFVLLQYGNTLQIADLRLKIEEMYKEDLPKNKKGEPIENLGKYCDDLLKNFETYLNYHDERTVSGGHKGIGTISNIFGKCLKDPYMDVPFLDMFKNKIINDISGVKWSIATPWNQDEEKPVIIKPEEINKKLMGTEQIRREEEALEEKNEREIVNYLIYNNIGSVKDKIKYSNKLKNTTLKKIYDIWQNTHFEEITYDEIKPSDLPSLYFNIERPKRIEESELFKQIVNKFGFNDLYFEKPKGERVETPDHIKKERKELKRIFNIMFKMEKGDYIKKDTAQKVKNWINS
jgi:hypothetical protein